jgi:hypothetical protein
LTDTNIKLALEDAGEDVEKILAEVPKRDLTDQCITRLDRYSFCCPSYDDSQYEGLPRHDGCLGYTNEDREKPAYWMFR